MKKNKKILKVMGIIISLLLFISSIGFMGGIIYSNILPFKYLIVLLGIMILLITFFISVLLKKKFKSWIKTTIILFSMIFIIIFSFGLYYINRTYNFMSKIKSKNMITEKYYVVINNDSTYNNIDDIKSLDVGTYDEKIELYDEAIKKLNSQVKVSLVKYDAVDKMARDLMKKKVDAIIISAAHKDTIDTDLENFKDSTKVLYEIDIKIEQKEKIEHPNINVAKEAFTIYLSGIDAYGNVSSRGRSDVNMLITINPNKYEVLLTSIPRDYYVQLHGTTGYRDKLTHAGFYGLDMSVNTIQDFMKIDIDYYVKVNFTTLTSIVDIIGGVDVYSDASFMPWTNNSIYINKGMVHMDGATALAFARERHAYIGGDRHRVQNQQDVITAIINKLTSSTELLTKYTSLLDSVSNSLVTNLDSKNITSLIKLQLDVMPSWNIKKYSVNGSDSSNYTHTYGTQLLYVMEPIQDTIDLGTTYINGMKNNKSFSELGIN